MPDDDEVNILEVDAVCDRLMADIDASTRSPGAEQAMRSGDRRRVAAGAMVLAAVLAAVLIGLSGMKVNLSIEPVATPAPMGLPEPRSFDPVAFNQAAAGWTSGWTRGASPVSTDLPCSPDSMSVVPEPVATSSTQFRTGKAIGATLTVERFDSPERAYERAWLLDGGSRCLGGDWEYPEGQLWDGGESISTGFVTSNQKYYVIGVMHESKVAVLTVAGAGRLPDEVNRQLVFALLADLRT